MFWDKKEDKKALPDLPPLKFPRVREDVGERFEHDEVGRSFDDETEKHELPSFPDNLNDKGFSQAAIKGAVSEPLGTGGVPEARPEQDKFKIVEMEEWKPESGGEENVGGMPEPPQEEERIPEAPDRLERREVKDSIAEKNKDIFVKLDKFYSARKALVDVQENLEDVDSLLKKIREIKMREEQELTGWEKDLEHVKARLNDVTVNLFEKVD